MKLRAILTYITVIVLLAACGAPAAPTQEASPSPAAAASPSPAAPAETTSTLPVTIEHKFGSTEIVDQPERVVTIGYSEQDAVLALGVKPIAVRDWFGDQPYAVWPWAQDELGDAQPEVLQMPFGELNFETIAALEPDLIVATHAGITEEEYTTLSQIAPTVAQSSEYPDFGMPWQEQTRVIGRALGREAQAEQQIAEVEAQIAAAREAHPELAGATVAWASPASDSGQFWVVGPNTPPMRFLTALGLEFPDALAEIIGDKDSVQISGEQLSLLDVDVLIWQVDSPEQRAAIESDPLYQGLDVAREDRAIFFVGLDDPIYGALSFSTVLSLPFAIEGLTPQIKAALDGRASAPEAMTETAATSPADAPTPGALEVLEETAQDRLIRHSLGESRVPRQPQRVVTLQDQNALLPLFELGFTDVVGSIGAVREDGSTYFRRMQNYDTSSVAYVGEYGTPSLEQIAALQPDLIVGSQYEITAENYALLSQIAPTVAVEQFTRPIWSSHDDFALLVNRQQEAVALKSRFDQRVAELKDRLVQPESITVSMFNVDEGGTINAEADPYIANHTVFDLLGLDQTPLVKRARAQDQFYVYEQSISMELLPQFDGDVIFVPYWGDAPGSDIAALQASPLWQRLNAVQKNQAYIVPGEQWYGLSYQPLFNILDALEGYLLDRPLDTSWEPPR